MQDLVLFLCHVLTHRVEGQCSLTYMQRGRTNKVWTRRVFEANKHLRLPLQTAEKCCSDLFLRDQSVKRGRKTPHDRSELCKTTVTTHPLWMEEIKASVFYSAFPPLIFIQFVSMFETESFSIYSDHYYLISQNRLNMFYVWMRSLWRPNYWWLQCSLKWCLSALCRSKNYWTNCPVNRCVHFKNYKTLT